jgi:hypothetical protein
MTKAELIARLGDLSPSQVAELDERIDELVHDAKSKEASDINNDGVEAQLNYLFGADTDEVGEDLAQVVNPPALQAEA